MAHASAKDETHTDFYEPKMEKGGEMMFVDNEKISKRQFSVLMLFGLFGTSLLFLPAELAGNGGRMGWQTAFVWGIALVGIQAVLCYLGSRFPEMTVGHWYGYVFGGVVGKILALALLVHILLTGALELRIFGEVISAMMLPKTPLWLLTAVFLLGILPVAVGGVEVVGRMAEVLFFFVGIPLVVVLVALMFSVDFGRLLPLDFVDGEAVQKTAIYFAPLSQGLLLTPFFFAQTKWKAGKKSVVGVVAVMLGLICLMTMLAFCAYGADSLSGKLFPMLQMMERVGFGKVFLSRQDLLFLWFWVVSAFLFLAMILLFATKLWCEILCIPSEKRGAKWVWFLCISTWVVSNIPDDLWQAYDARLSYLPYGNLVFLVILPVIMLLVDVVKRGRNHG